MNHSQQAAYAKTSYYGNAFVSHHQYIFFITLIWLLSLIWSKKVESHENWRVALTFSESRKQMSSFSECCIGLSVIFLPFICAFFAAWWDGGASQVVWEFYPTNLWAFKGKTRRVREVPERSYDRCVQQQSEKMKPMYPDVLLLILWYFILAKLCNSPNPKQSFLLCTKTKTDSQYTSNAWGIWIMPYLQTAIFWNSHHTT